VISGHSEIGLAIRRPYTHSSVFIGILNRTVTIVRVSSVGYYWVILEILTTVNWDHC